MQRSYIPIDFKTTNENDKKAMGEMLTRASSILGHNNFTALYDKGYHTGSELKIADQLGLNVLVAIPSVATHAPNKAYNVEHFEYNKAGDYYTCPQGEELHSTGKWHQAKTYKFKRYTTKSCQQCPVKSECSKAKYGKAIQRSEYQELIEKNKQRIAENETYYKQRQSIVEHPYGTVKRSWGFNYIMTKKYMERADADVGLIFTAYTLRRIFNIIGFEALKNYLKELLSVFLAYISSHRSQIKPIEPSYIFELFFIFLSFALKKSLSLPKFSVWLIL